MFRAPTIGLSFDPGAVFAARGRSRLWLCLLALAVSACAARAAAPKLYPGGAADVFYGLGVDGNGTVVIAGSRGADEGFFELNSAGFSFTRLQPVRFSQEPGVIVSRDGGYLATLSDDKTAALWPRATRQAEALPDFFPWDSVDAVTLIGGEAVVAGTVADGFTRLPVLWNSRTGLQDLSFLWGVGTTLNFLNPDGQIVAMGIRLGEPAILHGAASEALILHDQGNDNFDVAGFSPNSRFITANFGRTIFSQGILWSNLVPRLLAQPDDEPARAVGAVTDSGFIGGQGRSLTGTQPRDGSAFIIDPRDGRAHWFDEWWAGLEAAPPLGSAIAWVTDLYEANGQLYCLLERADRSAALAVVALGPPPGPQLAIASRPGGITLRWTASGNSTLETTAGLPGGWQALGASPTRAGDNFSIDLPGSDRARFFRVRVQ